MTNHRKLAGLIAVIIAVFYCKSPAGRKASRKKSKRRRKKAPSTGMVR
jgi:predicted LPLAT superfamily acyltransferase